MYKILIVEDDNTIAKAMEKHLTTWQYEVRCVLDFQNVMKDFAEFNPHIVLMDIMLPFFNGYHWCSEIRRVSEVPVIFISSASDNMNIVMAMNMGGDDFLPKPFSMDVLTAKLQAVLRRSYGSSAKSDLIEHDSVILNRSDATIVVGEKKIELTKNDYKILELLMSKIGAVVSREEIMQRLWDSDEFVDDNTLTVNIGRLRKKLEDAGVRDFIKTKKGLGYTIE